MWVFILKYSILILTGVSAGLAVAAGLFAFLVITGVIQRLATLTRTAEYLHYYEKCMAVGAIVGNLWWLWLFPIFTGPAGVGAAGLVTGIFTGCLIGAIAEVLNVFPIFFKHIRLKYVVTLVVWALAAGKAAGLLYWYFA